MPIKTNLANTQDLVGVEEIRENTIILKNGGLRQVIMASGVNFALKSETEQNIVTQAYQNFLNSVDFFLQIVIHSRKVNVEKYLSALQEHEHKEPSPLLQTQNAEYQEYIRSFVQKNPIMEKSFFVIVPWSPVILPTRGTLAKYLPFMKKDEEAEEKAKKEALADFTRNVQQLKQRVDQVLEGLAAIGLEATVLNDEQLIELLYNFYNPESIEREKMTLPVE